MQEFFLFQFVPSMNFCFCFWTTPALQFSNAASPTSIDYVSLYVARWFVAIGTFQSSLLSTSQVRFVVERLLCFLIEGINNPTCYIHVKQHLSN